MIDQYNEIIEKLENEDVSCNLETNNVSVGSRGLLEQVYFFLLSSIKIIQKLQSQIRLLKNSLRNIEKHIQPGVSRFNWYSLGISDYTAGCGKLLKSLNSIVTQVNQMKRDLDLRIENDIRCYNLYTTAKEQELDAPLNACKVSKIRPLRCCWIFRFVRRIETISYNRHDIT